MPMIRQAMTEAKASRSTRSCAPSHFVNPHSLLHHLACIGFVLVSHGVSEDVDGLFVRAVGVVSKHGVRPDDINVWFTRVRRVHCTTHYSMFPPGGPSHHTTLYGQRSHAMDTSTHTRCEYNHWWRRRGLRTRNEHPHRVEQNVVSLPYPSVLPASEFDDESFNLPPSYQETIDLEKALHLFPSPPTVARIDAATRLPSPAFTDPLLPEKRISCPPQQQTISRPPSRCIRIGRYLRYSAFTVYRRLFTFVFVLNSIGALILIRHHQYRFEHAFTLDTLAAFASSNFLLAIFVRQDSLVNLLFRSAWLVSWNVPLRIRKIAARVYCYGGVHSGAAIAGTLWWMIFTVALSWTFATAGLYMFIITILTWVVLILLLTILLLALPLLRARYHDTFEITHRFLGWTSIALFWAQLLLLTKYTASTNAVLGTPVAFSTLLIHTPTFYTLTLITLFLIYPWLHLRRWTFTATPLSTHALLLTFPNPVHKFSCLSISTSPLLEWHPFATFPSSPRYTTSSPINHLPSTKPTPSTTSLVISSAGNWTSTLIHTAHGKTTSQLAPLSPHPTGRETGTEGATNLRFWVKGHPKAGVLSLSCLFPRVVILTTGSGIGPALSSLLDRPARQFVRLVWSARAPLQTYGERMLELVGQADQEAVVVDTSAMGRPDLLEIAVKVYREVGAEAVFVLSNEKVTRMVVGGLEKRGICAFGPIWDS
ncbi:hypothetical protein T440DRAFT_227944 [Plenodomus tracheiphilus IPT5]|uniref:Integral membrane protein TmpA n=1 Tax=Plenodomus tracheiphilus IPT5 TaxID=1408161 RepID=A0A6A7AWP9_9PLEO|nr:hypothetical protein T440DRAFT_227944 [Plenodomus tracheiphilus IPT5]